MSNSNSGNWEVQGWCWQVEYLERTHLLVHVWDTSVMSLCGGKGQFSGSTFNVALT